MSSCCTCFGLTKSTFCKWWPLRTQKIRIAVLVLVFAAVVVVFIVVFIVFVVVVVVVVVLVVVLVAVIGVWSFAALAISKLAFVGPIFQMDALDNIKRPFTPPHKYSPFILISEIHSRIRYLYCFRVIEHDQDVE